MAKESTSNSDDYLKAVFSFFHKKIQKSVSPINCGSLFIYFLEGVNGAGRGGRMGEVVI